MFQINTLMPTINLLENLDFVKFIKKNNRIIGLDFGTKNIGISICNSEKSFAIPLLTINFTSIKDFIFNLKKIIEEKNVAGIVVGNPVNMNGSIGPAAKKVKNFCLNVLKEINIPITLWDERLSTEAVFKSISDLNISNSKKRKKIDEKAASYILQGFLDFFQKNKDKN